MRMTNSSSSSLSVLATTDANANNTIPLLLDKMNSSLSLGSLTNSNFSLPNNPIPITPRTRRNSASDDRRTMSFTIANALNRTKREMMTSSSSNSSFSTTLSSSSSHLLHEHSNTNNAIEHENFNCPLTMSGGECRLCPAEIQPNYSYNMSKRYRSHSLSHNARSIEIESEVPLMSTRLHHHQHQLQQSHHKQSRDRESPLEKFIAIENSSVENNNRKERPDCRECKRAPAKCSCRQFCDDDESCGVKLNFKLNLTQSCAMSQWNLEFASKLHRFIARFSGRRRRPRIRALNSLATSPWATMTSFICVIIIVVTTCLPFHIADACSSRSTPKPRPPSPTLRPNITIQTYTCPPEYDAHYCLNGATCFTVKIGESILYNCECAEGYMGQRCEFKDLDGSYLPSKQRAMLEQASVTSSAAIVIVLVVIVCFYLYVRSRRKFESEMRRRSDMTLDETDCVDGGYPRRMPFSGSMYYNTYHHPTTISLSSSQSLHSPSSSPYHHPDAVAALGSSVPHVEPTLHTSSQFSLRNVEPPDPGPTPP